MTQPEPQRIPVATSPPYCLYIGPGASRLLPAWLVEQRLAARYALVTDSNVAALHARPLHSQILEVSLSAEILVFPAGEAHKTRATKEKLEDAMLAAEYGRDSAIIALGGGVTADLAGFIAATYQRGIPYVQVPTTLLAMVDASVGGKTGVDHPKGKNLIGAFHQPGAVFIDIDFLATLPEREFRSGLAEVVKAGVIRDAALFRRLAPEAARIVARDPGMLSQIITKACEIKAEVVAADARESDLRKILNFGHTIGHALETLSCYRMAHGEAVSIGMVAEARMAARLGMLSHQAAGAIEATLAALGLPVRIPREPSDSQEMLSDSILRAARLDKKAREGRIAYVLPAALGVMSRGPAGYGIAVEDALVAEVLSEMQETALPG